MKNESVSIFIFLIILSTSHGAENKVDFNRDIRQVLADKCYACHGPDAEEVQGDLRLDLRDNAIGTGAIVPNKVDESTLIARIFSIDNDELMPPPDSHKELTGREKQLLEQWVAEGAEYKEHWAFLKAKRPQPPMVGDKDRVKNDIDRFVMARHVAAGLKTSGEASRETLIRRVSLDLRGFPPSLEEVDEFLNNSDPIAYERMVDRMLNSPHFGEKMTRIWMDLARYGDTNGYHYDSTRQVWLWRDWVINAYNNNMPFDQFVIEQLAGDLMPNATINQKVASGFNRNTRYNEEGGADPDEWRVRYAVDRTIVLGQVFFGMTINCAECHSHKYDPISQKEFYQLYAFFNSFDEPGAQGHNQKYPPFVQVQTDESKAAAANAKEEIASLEQRIKSELEKITYTEPTDLPDAPRSVAVDKIWIDDTAPEGARVQGGWSWVEGKEHQVNSGTRSTRRSGKGLTQHFFDGAAKPLVIEKGDALFQYVWLDPKDPPKTIQMQFNSGQWMHRAHWGADLGFAQGAKGPTNFPAGPLPALGKWVRLEIAAEKVGLKPGAKINGWAFTQFDGTVYYDTAGVKQQTPDERHLHSLALWEKRASADNAVLAEVKNAIRIAAEKRNDQQQKLITDYYVEHVFADTRTTFAALHKQIGVARDKVKKAEESLPFQLVTVEMAAPRDAFVLMRGNFLKPGEKVERDTPKVFPPFPADKPRNRLGLAHWLVGGQHPLTARVAVNRYWAQLFGRGIVETVGDFGHLGRFPTHPDLLDWLAVEFEESGWDTKHMIKLMVMSAAYRQSSVNDHRHDDVDKDNKLIWRAPRFRMPAEEIRDTALRVAGLLSPKVGGPPVFPYQPTDYYKGKKGGWAWNLSKGEDRYRRGMYTFWRRTTPYPTFIIFDAPDRSECEVSRARTNTPLQALVTMNDPQFVEAARVLGQRILSKGPTANNARLAYAFRLATNREPNEEELAVLRELLEEQLAHYKANDQDANALAQYGEFERPKDLDTVEHAAWTAIANALLNLDEVITRE